MAKEKYEVVRAWSGVKVGQVIELDGEPHPSLVPNLRKVGGKVPVTDDGSSLIDAARTEAAKIIAAAEEEAKGTLDAAAKIKEEAVTEAAKIVAAAKTPPPPPKP